MSGLSKKFIAICGMAFGVAVILLSLRIYRSSLDLLRELSLFVGPNEHPPYLLVGSLAVLGVAVIIAAFNFGFRKHGDSKIVRRNQ